MYRLFAYLVVFRVLGNFRNVTVTVIVTVNVTDTVTVTGTVTVTVTGTMTDVLTTFFFVIKPTGYTNFTNSCCHETLHVSDSSSAHHQQFIHCTLSNGICHTGLYSAGPGWNCSSIPVLLSVQ